MSAVNVIAPTHLRDYAKSRGWVLIKEAAKDRLYVLTHPAFPRRQLVFPMDTAAPDYSEAINLVLEKLAEIEARPYAVVFKNVIETGDDALAFRIASPRIEDRALPLSFASSILEGAEQMLRASVCTVLKPQVHHPRMSRTEAQQFLEAAKFRHTQPGSFILNVSCPVQAMGTQTLLSPHGQGAPFVRRATSALHHSLVALVNSIETDSVDALIEEEKSSKSPSLSSNFCEALTRFEDEALKNSLEIEVTWAASLAPPAGEKPISIVRIQNDYFRRIEEVRRELRSSERLKDDIFIGTVERLEGEMGPDGRRSGSVILSLLLPDEDAQVRARANLNADDYAKAHEAHMSDGAYVKVTGVLHPGRQPRQLTEPGSFEVIKR